MLVKVVLAIAFLLMLYVSIEQDFTIRWQQRTIRVLNLVCTGNTDSPQLQKAKKEKPHGTRPGSHL